MTAPGWIKLTEAWMFGDDHGVAAQRCAVGVAGVFKKIEQAFFVQQARDDGPVAFLVLRAQLPYLTGINVQVLLR
jgi:hypothetical protein